MKEPKDFPKALWAVTICEIVTFTLCGAIMYHYVGEQYMTAPAFGSLKGNCLKIAFSFAVPTIIFLGSLYSVSLRLLCYLVLPLLIYTMSPCSRLPHASSSSVSSTRHLATAPTTLLSAGVSGLASSLASGSLHSSSLRSFPSSRTCSA